MLLSWFQKTHQHDMGEAVSVCTLYTSRFAAWLLRSPTNGQQRDGTLLRTLSTTSSNMAHETPMDLHLVQQSTEPWPRPFSVSATERKANLQGKRSYVALPSHAGALSIRRHPPDRSPLSPLSVLLRLAQRRPYKGAIRT